MRDELREHCRGRWHSIMVQLGFPHVALSGYNRPCPMCQGKDRFQFSDIDGKGTWHCRGCGGPAGTGGGGDGFALAMKFLGTNFSEAAKRIEAVVGAAKVGSRRNSAAQRDEARDIQQWLWKNAQPLSGNDPPSWYLASRRIDVIPPGTAVRFADSVKYEDPDTKETRYLPAMISRLVAPDDSRGVIHATYLTPLGTKADVQRVKQFAKGAIIPRGGAVRLSAPGEDMGIAEGVETALSAAILFRKPVWAALSTAGLLNFVPPAACRKLTIYADRDAKFGGQMTAYCLAYKLATHTDIAVKVEMPTTEEWKDWNDALKARPAADNVIVLPR